MSFLMDKTTNAWTSIPGRTDGSVAPAGAIGEMNNYAASAFNQASPVLNTLYTIITQTLGVGTWKAFYISSAYLTSTGVNQVASIFFNVSGGAYTFLGGYSQVFFGGGIASGNNTIVPIHLMGIYSVTSAITFPVVMYSSSALTGSPGTPTAIGAYAGSLSFLRIS